MRKSNATTISGLGLAVLMLFASGCATNTSQIDSVRQMAQQALDAANQASAKADQANSAAQDAAGRADRAMQAAQDAKGCCDRNSQKIEQVLQRSMQK